MLAYTIAALSPNMDVANAALPTYVTALLFFAGCLIRWSDIPNYWKWFGYIDVLRYAYGSLMKNQFNGDRNVQVGGGCECAHGPRAPRSLRQRWAPLGACRCFLVLPALPGAPRTTSLPGVSSLLQFVQGLDVLDYYSLRGINMWGWIGIEACFTVGERSCQAALHCVCSTSCVATWPRVQACAHSYPPLTRSVLLLRLPGAQVRASCEAMILPAQP